MSMSISFASTVLLRVQFCLVLFAFRRPFFLGFGLPCTLLSSFFHGYYLNAGVFYMVFPLVSRCFLTHVKFFVNC